MDTRPRALVVSETMKSQVFAELSKSEKIPQPARLLNIIVREFCGDEEFPPNADQDAVDTAFGFFAAGYIACIGAFQRHESGDCSCPNHLEMEPIKV